VIDLHLDRQSLKIALPSFCIPFACGLATAFWLAAAAAVDQLAGGRPVVRHYRHSGVVPVPAAYQLPAAATRRLVQTAILIDLTCWTCSPSPRAACT
jgi:hypothetical protein